MKMLTRRLAAVLLVLTMVIAVCPIGNAAEQVDLLKLSAAAEEVAIGDEVVVTVSATVADVVADGKLSISYNSKVLEFLGVEAGSAWPENSDLSLQANPDVIDEITVAFAGVYAAKEGSVLELKFQVVGEGSADIVLASGESYISDAEDYNLGSELTVSIACPSAKFVDLNTDEYYHEGVDYVLKKGYMIGMSEDRFSPGTDLTRAQIVTILYRMAGEPEVTGTTPFRDVTGDTWFTDAVVWAYQNEITNGMDKNWFAPMQAVSREQMVTFFARYSRSCGTDTESDQDLSGYTDADMVSNYAADSMRWAVETGLIEGVEENVLDPKGKTSRAQAATVVYRYCTLIMGEKGR